LATWTYEEKRLVPITPPFAIIVITSDDVLAPPPQSGGLEVERKFLE
jgi:hypothetical protein